MASTDAAFSQSFYTDFQAQYAALHGQLSLPLLSSLDQAQKDLASLTKLMSDATGSLPSYDQRKYENQIKELENMVDRHRANKDTKRKGKFTFKRTTATPGSEPSAPSHSHLDLTSTNATISANLPSSTSLSLSSRSNSFITLSILPSPHIGALTISNIADSIIDLRQAGDAQPEFSSVHLTSLSSCFLALPPISSSVIIHSLSRCVIILSCHQLRIHDSTKTDIYLNLHSSNAMPILENCSRLRFGNHPDHNPVSGYSYTPQDFSSVLASTKNWEFIEVGKIPDVSSVFARGNSTEDAKDRLSRLSLLPSA